MILCADETKVFHAKHLLSSIRILEFLRLPKPGRASLAYDLAELHREAVTRAVFTFVKYRTFKREDLISAIKGLSVSRERSPARSPLNQCTPLQRLCAYDPRDGSRAWFRFSRYRAIFPATGSSFPLHRLSAS
ncbi:MAG: CRISPR-associated endonuclease Cas1, partial [Methylocella sp.]